MKVKILEKTFIGAGGNLHAGTEHEIEDNIAERLIARGVAKKAKKAAPKKKKADAATKEVIDHDAHQELIQDEPRYNDLHRDLKKKKY